MLAVFEILDVTKYFAKCSFFLHKFISRQFYTNENFLYQLSFFMLPILLLNWNKTCCIDLFSTSFVKLLNIRLDDCSLFLSHLKSVFLIVIGREQNHISASLQEDHKSVISCNHKCPAAQVQIWRRTEKQVQHQTHKLISFFYDKLS